VDYVTELARRGHPTVVLYVGAEEPPELPGLVVEDYRAPFAAPGGGDV
jgi:hypothetical protein